MLKRMLVNSIDRIKLATFTRKVKQKGPWIYVVTMVYIYRKFCRTHLVRIQVYVRTHEGGRDSLYCPHGGAQGELVCKKLRMVVCYH